MSKDRWHQKAKPVLGCLPNHTIQKHRNRLTVKGQHNYTEQLQKQYITTEILQEGGGYSYEPVRTEFWLFYGHIHIYQVAITYAVQRTKIIVYVDYSDGPV